MQTTDLLEELRRLPMRPSAVTQVLSALDDPAADARDVASALQVDPSLCARILHLANSPYFGLSGKIGSVERAVVALGASVIRSLTVSTAAGLFGEKAQEMPDGFWAHSLTVAAGASVAARQARVPAGDALCAGLLHDLGAALMFRFDTDGYNSLVASAASPAALLEAEAERFGGNHAVIGAFALDAWKLPSAMVEAVRLHHDDPSTFRDRLAHAVIAGEALARIVGGDDAPFSHEPRREAGQALALLGCGAAKVDVMVERTIEESQALDAVLNG